ncbi:dihydroxy-acid dehydratase [Desulforhopalus singaporensis]|uniref:Dihydroxy-acid dehydratase n=1 Tax=Desulforhopalus singaporensis TaxID=91360 RepID=A0A1H0SLF0_9BACT|nr:dihydroxy-acid dehydratase [Desulforhopalus singaporensis]SDP42662.1 dihydroxy-acid dehydratase [Desulforhopalus singaporensis]
MATVKKNDCDLPDYALVERQTMMSGAGYADEGVDRIQIGIVSSWGEINPAAVNIDKVVDAVKAGVWAGGGAPRVFVISSICTSMCGDENYHLPHRDLVAGYIETVSKTNLFDGLVFVPVCDDVIPGHLMAAARLDLPATVVTGGYMQLNRHKRKEIDPLEVAPKYYRQYKEGGISKAEYSRIKDKGCMGIGACPVMGTANTMAAMTEALGMSLPGNTATPGADSRLLRIAFEAGRRVVQLHQKRIRPSTIMSRKAFENAIRLLMATGGSTNGVLHLQAIAAELGIDIPLETFNELSKKTPFIVDVAPSGSGKFLMADLDEAGGIPAVMKEMAPLLHCDAMTVTGQTVGDNLRTVEPEPNEMIYPLDRPMAKEGGLLFLRGNLAPEGALIKKSAVPESMIMHRGPARIFQNEDDASKALINNEIVSGSVVVVRNVGPQGDPGMRLLYRFLWIVAAKGMQEEIALITDGRFSGTNKGCAVAHICPEASVGGPLALVEEGDIIEIDIPNEKINLKISEEEFAKRAKNWSPPRRSLQNGYLSVYARNAKSASQGAALNYKP